MINEVWVFIEIAPDYMISNLGNIISLKGKGFRLLNPTLEPIGYRCVRLRVNGKYINKRIHQLVAIAFIPNPENKSSVNHIDANKSNNNVTNLEWCTQQENICHAFSLGLISRKKGKFSLISGAQNYGARKVVDTKTGEIFDTVTEAAEINNIKRATLSNMLNNYRKNDSNLIYL